MKIEPDVIRKIGDSVKELLQTYEREMSMAMKEEGGVSISIPVKMAQTASKGLVIAVGISFVKSRIKDQIDFTINNQKDIPYETTLNGEEI